MTNASSEVALFDQPHPVPIMREIKSLADVPDNCEIYLYGAGDVGQAVNDLLEGNGFTSVIGFIDSWSSGTKSGKPVLAVDEYKRIHDRSHLVLICSATNIDIAAELVKRDIGNFADAWPLYFSNQKDTGELAYLSPADEDAERDASNRATLAALLANDLKPETVHIQVARKCNLKCTMRSWGIWESNEGFIEPGLFREILADLKANGIKRVVLANAQGEPFLHPKIFELIDTAVEQGFWVMVATNGTPFNEARVQRIARSGLAWIQFSFAGYDKESYESIYVGGKWEQVSRNLQQMRAALREVGAKTKFLINGIVADNTISITDPVTFRSKSVEYLMSIGVNRGEIRIKLPHNFGGTIDVGKLHEDHSVFSHAETLPRRPVLCHILVNQPGIFFDGRATACGCLDSNGTLKIGDVRSESLVKLRQGPEFRALLDTFINGDISKVPLCNKCDMPFLRKGDNIIETL
jgi:MoaA/NifB/PqqE/SkfB family radical SAM enzyme